MKSRQPQLGLSLIELLVSLGLMATLALIATPVLSAFTGHYQLQAASEQLALEIARARMQAIGQNVFTRVRVANAQYVRERSTDGTTYVADDAMVSLPRGVTAVVEAGGSPSFNRSGLAPLTTTIIVQSEHGTRTVRTNVLGRVTIS